MSKVSKWGKVKEAVVHRTLRGPELIQAVKDGDVAVVQTLLENGRVDPNSTDHKSKSTALHFAALRGHTEVVLLLCKAGADVRATTPLHKVSALHRFVAVTCCSAGPYSPADPRGSLLAHARTCSRLLAPARACSHLPALASSPPPPALFKPVLLEDRC